jgi:putative MATE family efflux protein
VTNDLTRGSISKNLLYFTAPYLLSYFLQTLYGMADLFIIGQFDGADATTAVSIGSQVMHMITVMIVGLAMGTTVGIGHAVGAGDKKRAKTAIGNTLTLFLTLSVVGTALLLLLVNPIVSVMSTPDEAVAGARIYLIICFAGIPFITAYNIIASVFRGLGDSKSPMYFIAVACVANIILDYVFIGAMDMGAAGAALGTTLSQALSVIISVVAVIKKKRELIPSKSDLHPQKSVMSELLRTGVPIALQDGLIQVAFIVITIIANKRGLTDAAAVGIVEKIISFLFLVPSSLLSAVSALCAQNIGAGKQDRADRTLRYALFAAVGFGVVVAVIMQFAAGFTVGLFQKDAAVVAAGEQYLKGYVFDVIFAGIHFSFSGYFCACNKSYISFIHNISAIALVRIPGVYLMSVKFPDTLLPMGLATAMGSLVSAVICAVAFAILKRNRMLQGKTQVNEE